MNPARGRKEAIPISDIYHFIDRLEKLLNESWRMPLSAYLVINEDDFLDVIDQMRTAIPREIRDAEKIQRERERVIAQAEEEADRIVQRSREQADELLSDHEIIRAAATREQTIIERARNEAQVLKSEADEYAREVLVALNEQVRAMEDQIAALLKTVQNGLHSLNVAQEQTPEEPESQE
jgi:cell division septum initiation protein DivIVA